MAASMEASGETAPAPDWRDQLLANYQAEGFIIWEIVPSPADHPVERAIWNTGGRLEFEQTDLPYTDPNETDIEHRYKATLEGHKSEFGQDNVFVAHVTADMEAAHPEYTEHPHRVVMVRTAGLL